MRPDSLEETFRSALETVDRILARATLALQVGNLPEAQEGIDNARRLISHRLPLK